MIGPFDDPLFPDYQINSIGIATRKYSGKQCLFFYFNFNDLGVPLSKEKTLGPCKAISFLGITLDSNLMQASLPSDKLNHIREVKRNAKKLVSFSKRDLLSLLGHLNFAMQIIPQGSFFIARLLDFSKSVKDLNDIVTLDQRFSIPVLSPPPPPPRSAYFACLSLLTHLIQIIGLLEVRSMHELCSD